MLIIIDDLTCLILKFKWVNFLHFFSSPLEEAEIPLNNLKNRRVIFIINLLFITEFQLTIIFLDKIDLANHWSLICFLHNRSWWRLCRIGWRILSRVNTFSDFKDRTKNLLRVGVLNLVRGWVLLNLYVIFFPHHISKISEWFFEMINLKNFVKFFLTFLPTS
jgi:hypothetical protein